ncbi:MAG: alanine--tRNA ligase [Dehalococcoidia bacterium]|nr:alanine--tRNA ligase [Dehalococcoidia bacterium]
MNVDDIRRSFLQFFEEREHRRMQSAPLVPIGDPTLLFTSAGMVPFKPYFMGVAQPPSQRMTSVQKCFRTTDIDAVGDTNHLTFFEMLGNFSIGDYFKREAIDFAWAYLTGVLGMAPERLWITVYEDDDEAAGYWREEGVPENRIMRYGVAEGNYWFSGDVGPCGPCSELHYDFGEQEGCPRCADGACHPAIECGRFLEIWNLVFMAFFQHEDGSKTPLPSQNIDTGAGLERLAWVVQQQRSVYETDVFSPILARVGELTGKLYGEEATADRAMRVVAEHGRAVTFLIADGVLPGNEGRGYVLRRELRRAVYFAGTLGLDRPFLEEVAAAVIAQMGQAYPEIERQGDFIRRAIRLEEQRFRETIHRGMALLDETIAGMKGDRIAGADVFKLYDTYGLPRELTAEIAAGRGLSIDEAGYERAMEEQRTRARTRARFTLKEEGAAHGDLAISETRFVGYERLSTETTLAGIIGGGGVVETAEQGDEVDLFLVETPFYAEGGGQVGDTGTISGPNGKAEVMDTVHAGALYAHRARVTEGRLSQGDAVAAEVDAVRRADIRRNHTATHLLQASLRTVLGDHIRQAGSLVAPDRLRFDFTHVEGLKAEELREVQRLVNKKLRQDLPVRTRETAYDRAIEEGIIAFFGEKYGNEVRVVEVVEDGPAPEASRFSAELCGGTHVGATGEIGSFIIVSESSIGAGVRRIEALTGRGSEQHVERLASSIESMARALSTAPTELEARVTALLRDLEAERRKAQRLERQMGTQSVEGLLERVRQVDGVAVLATKAPATSAEVLREVGEQLLARLESGVIVLGAEIGDRPSFIAMVSADLTARGLSAVDLVRGAAALTGGGGGGRPEMAQAGGKDASRIDEALATVEGLVRERLAPA